MPSRTGVTVPEDTPPESGASDGCPPPGASAAAVGAGPASRSSSDRGSRRRSRRRSTAAGGGGAGRGRAVVAGRAAIARLMDAGALLAVAGAWGDQGSRFREVWPAGANKHRRACTRPTHFGNSAVWWRGAASAAAQTVRQNPCADPPAAEPPRAARSSTMTSNKADHSARDGCFVQPQPRLQVAGARRAGGGGRPMRVRLGNAGTGDRRQAAQQAVITNSPPGAVVMQP